MSKPMCKVDVEVGTYMYTIQVRKLNVFVGENGCGKSEIIKQIIRKLEMPNFFSIPNHFNHPEVDQNGNCLDNKRAADIGSQIAAWAGVSTRPVFVETNNDYVVQRIIQDVSKNVNVRDEKIRERMDACLASYHELSYIFVDKGETGISIHHMSTDECGNILGAPKNFRVFEMQECDAQLGMI